MTGASTPPHSEFQLVDYRLVAVQLTSSRSGEIVKLPTSVTVDRTVLSDARLDDGTRSAVLRLRVRGNAGGDEPDSLTVDATVEGRFEAKPDFDDDLWTRILIAQAPALIYTQLRPIVRSLALEAGFNFVLPLLNFAAMSGPSPSTPGADAGPSDGSSAER
jgi:preprotein translocase subunit SecB